MKKALKIIGISLASLVVLVILGVTVVIYGVFTPKRLTPVVNQVADSLLIAPHSLDRVELTFWSTFPHFGLELENLCIVNPKPEAPSDTLICVPSLVVELNTQAFIENKQLLVNEIDINDGFISLFIDSAGVGNYDVFKLPADTAQTDSSAVMLPFTISLDRLHLGLKHIDFVSLQDSLFFKSANLALDAKLDMDSTLFPIVADISKLELNMQDLHASLHGKVTVADSLVVRADELDVSLDKLALHTDGNFAMSLSDGGINTDIKLSVPDWTVANALSACGLPVWNCLPSLQRTMGSIPSMLPDSLSLAATLNLSAHIFGSFDSLTLPKADAVITLSDITASYDTARVPYLLDSALVDISVHADLMHPKRCNVTVNDLHASAHSLYNPDTEKPMTLAVSGTLTDIFPKDNWKELDPFIKMNIDVSADIREGNPYLQGILDSTVLMLPELVYNIHSMWIPNGNSTARAAAALEQFKKHGKNTDGIQDYVNGGLSLHSVWHGNRLSQFSNVDINHLTNNIVLAINDFSVNLDKDCKFGIDSLKLTIDSPVSDSVKKVIRSMGSKGHTENVQNLINYAFKLNIDNVSASLPDLTVKVPGIDLDYMGEFDPDSVNKEIETNLSNLKLQDLTVHIDSEYIWLKQPMIDVKLKGQDDNPYRKQWEYLIASDSLRYTMQSGRECIVAGNLRYNLIEREQKDTSNYYLQWKPEARLTLANFHGDAVDSDIKVDMPLLDVNVKRQDYYINRSRIAIGNSDFSLTGSIKNVGLWQTHKGKLTADLKFKSDYTDVDELIDICQKLLALRTLYGFENEEEKTEIPKQTVDDDTPKALISLPTDMDVVLRAGIDRCRVFRQNASDLHADLYMHDGEATLQNVTFKSDAANLNLDARLVAPVEPGKAVPDSSYLGFNFDMRDIDIAKVVDIVPKVDSVMPMLRALSGKVDVNLVYSMRFNKDQMQKSDNNFASLTLEGRQLKLIPGDIYHTIAVILALKDKSNGIIDSLYAEAKMVNDTVMVYPFLLALDKVRIAVDGTNMLDDEGNLASIKYHASMYKPIIAGVNIFGPLDNLQYKIVLPKYGRSFTPVRYYTTEQQAQTLEKEIESAAKMVLDIIKN